MIVVEGTTNTMITILLVASGTSMNPTFYDEDMVRACSPILYDSCKFNAIKIGDIIQYSSIDKESVMHRVIAIEKDSNNQNIFLLCKGDNIKTNPTSIPELDVVTKQEYKSKIILEQTSLVF